MKKKQAFIFVLTAVLLIAACVIAVSAANRADLKAVPAVVYYDQFGNEITVDGLYYNNQGLPVFNAGCYYLDDDGEAVYVGGCRVYYTDATGNLAAGRYCYNADGTIIPLPRRTSRCCR